MRIIVTGGAGFIGSALIRHLIENTREKILNIDKLTYASSMESLIDVSQSQRYKFLDLDICNMSALNAVFEEFKPEAVINLAAETHVDRSISSPAVFIQTNIVGTFNLLEVTRVYLEKAENHLVKKFRFLHVSTDEVFGDLPHPNYQMDANELKFTEKSAYAPRSPYAATKASSDVLVRAWQQTYGLPTLITNSSNNYGEYQFPDKFIPRIITNALRGKPLPVYGNGENIRDWLHVRDHARALYLVLTNGRIGESYNIGGNSERQNIDVVSIICDTLEILSANRPSGTSRYSALIEFVDDRIGHDLRYAIDTTKIETELSWQPEYQFEKGLIETIAWYINNQAWWKKLVV